MKSITIKGVARLHFLIIKNSTEFERSKTFFLNIGMDYFEINALKYPIMQDTMAYINPLMKNHQEVLMYRSINIRMEMTVMFICTKYLEQPVFGIWTAIPKPAQMINMFWIILVA